MRREERGFGCVAIVTKYLLDRQVRQDLTKHLHFLLLKNVSYHSDISLDFQSSEQHEYKQPSWKVRVPTLLSDVVCVCFSRCYITASLDTVILDKLVYDNKIHFY